MRASLSQSRTTEKISAYKEIPIYNRLDFNVEWHFSEKGPPEELINLLIEFCKENTQQS